MDVVIADCNPFCNMYTQETKIELKVQNSCFSKEILRITAVHKLSTSPNIEKHHRS